MKTTAQSVLCCVFFCIVAHADDAENDLEQPSGCAADADCSGGARCRVVDVAMGPGIAPVYAEDDAVAERFAIANIAARSDDVEIGDEPACDGNCAPYAGDLTIRRLAPLTECVVDEDDEDDDVVEDADAFDAVESDLFRNTDGGEGE